MWVQMQELMAPTSPQSSGPLMPGFPGFSVQAAQPSPCPSSPTLSDARIVIGSGWWITSDCCYFLSEIEYGNF